MSARANKRQLDTPIALFDNHIIASGLVSIRTSTAKNEDYLQLFRAGQGLYPWRIFNATVEPIFRDSLRQEFSKQRSINVCYGDVAAPILCNTIIQDTWRLLSVTEGVVLFYELIGGQYNGKEDGVLLHRNTVMHPRVNYSFWDCGSQGIFMVMITFDTNRWTLFCRKVVEGDMRTVLVPGNRVFLNNTLRLNRQ